MIHTTKIYLVTNCYGDPNKVYIGKTKNSRESAHRRKYGSEITYTEIDYTSEEYWKLLECFWIHYFKFLGFEVLNENEGGGGPATHSEETRLKMRKPKSEEWKEKMRKPRLTTERMRKPKPGAGGRGPRSEETKHKMRGRVVSSEVRERIGNKLRGTKRPDICRSVCQYDLQGNFIQKFNSMSDANIFLGKDKNSSHINQYLKGKYKHAYGFLWKID